MPSILTILSLPARYRIWKPAHISLIMADLAGINRQPRQDDRTHLEATINWIKRAQDQRDGQADVGSVAAGWSFEDGWLPGYPETTGYIIETFLAAADILNQPDLKDRANRMIDWELSIQNEDGSFPGHFGETASKPVIFNTGQITHGMMAGYEQLGRAECLESAVRAGHWMVRQQDADGCYRRSVHNDTPHTYNTRSVWAQLRAGLAANDQVLVESARKNVQWAMSQQTDCGWYDTNAFVPGVAPFTHTIAYAIRGVLECGLLLEDESMVNSAVLAADGLAKKQRSDGWLAGTYADGWQEASRYSCLTGVAQMSINWIRIAQSTDRKEFMESARAGIEYVKSNQRILRNETPQDGGIAGSAPIWGRYSMFEFPNWAAKFFADALMMQMAGISVPAVKG